MFSFSLLSGRSGVQITSGTLIAMLEALILLGFQRFLFFRAFPDLKQVLWPSLIVLPIFPKAPIFSRINIFRI